MVFFYIFCVFGPKTQKKTQQGVYGCGGRGPVSEVRLGSGPVRIQGQNRTELERPSTLNEDEYGRILTWYTNICKHSATPREQATREDEDRK